MRFAISAVAAVSGLFLLTLAFYGQPAVYLRQAQDQWDELMDRPVANRTAVPAGDLVGRAAPPQQDPASLNGERAARQESPREREAALSAPLLEPVPGSHPASPSPPLPPESAPPGAVAASPPGPASVAPSAASKPPLVASALPAPQPEASQPLPTVPPVAAAALPPPSATQVPERHEAGIEPAAAVPGSAQLESSEVEQAKSEQATQAKSQRAKPEPVKSEQAKPEPAKSERAKAEQAKAEQAKSEQAKAEQAKSEQGSSEQAKSEQATPEQAKPEQVRTQSPKVEPSKREQVKPEPTKSDSPKPGAPSKIVVAQRPVAAPPPLPPALAQPPQPTLSQSPPQEPSPVRQEADDTQSVLARLRQLSPSVPVAQQADPSPVPEPRPRPTSSSSLPRLNAARAALAGGQIEDARRLLQQVQLQLVFGPVDAPDEALPMAGKGAVDVAHALDALSANDVPLSRRYIDVAMGDLSGSPTNPPIQQSDRRASGYAPAYPPH